MKNFQITNGFPAINIKYQDEVILEDSLIDDSDLFVITIAQRELPSL